MCYINASFLLWDDVQSALRDLPTRRLYISFNMHELLLTRGFLTSDYYYYFCVNLHIVSAQRSHSYERWA